MQVNNRHRKSFFRYIISHFKITKVKIVNKEIVCSSLIFKDL